MSATHSWNTDISSHTMVRKFPMRSVIFVLFHSIPGLYTYTVKCTKFMEAA